MPSRWLHIRTLRFHSRNKRLPHSLPCRSPDIQASTIFGQTIGRMSVHMRHSVDIALYVWHLQIKLKVISPLPFQYTQPYSSCRDASDEYVPLNPNRHPHFPHTIDAAPQQFDLASTSHLSALPYLMWTPPSSCGIVQCHPFYR